MILTLKITVLYEVIADPINLWTETEESSIEFNQKRVLDNFKLKGEIDKYPTLNATVIYKRIKWC